MHFKKISLLFTPLAQDIDDVRSMSWAKSDMNLFETTQN